MNRRPRAGKYTMRPLQRCFDAAALRHNWHIVRRHTAAANIMAVVKSRGYGHGLHFVAAALGDLADGFAVVNLADARILREHKIEKPILLMSGIFSAAEARELSALNLWTAVHAERQVRWLTDLPAGSNLTVLLKTDVGMNRLGFDTAEAALALDTLSRAPAVSQAALMAHFADADKPRGLRAPLAKMAALRSAAAFVSLGNSAASLLHGDFGDDWARVGIALYGSSPAPQWRSRDDLGLRAVMTLRTELLATRIIRAGEAAGYGGEWRAAKDTRAGVAACGYGDGYPRAKHMYVLVHGKRAAILGRVSMELIIIDLSDCADAAVGDEVICWGESLSIDEVAACAGQISYQLLTAAGVQHSSHDTW